MNFKQCLFYRWTGVQLPAEGPIASTPVESIGCEDILVEIYTTLFLDAQGKLQSIEEIIDELENESE